MPPLPPERRRAQDLSDEAIDWLVRLHSGADQDATARALEAWLQQGQAHREAFAAAKELWADLGTLSDVPVVTPSPRTPAPWLRKTMPTALRAIAAVLVLVVLGTYLPDFLRTVQAELAEYHTGLGEQSIVHLVDGTTVHLNTNTALNVSMTGTHRRVTLLEGEANFEVTPDPHRPFAVTTAGTTVRALGTEFTVHRVEDGTIVTVFDHAVAVSQPDPSPSSRSPVIVEEGQRVRVAEGTGIGPVETVNPMMARAWQRGKLMFDDEPLGHVVAELNRYHAGAIIMMNAELDALPVTGVFNLTDTHAALQAIQENLRISNLTITPYLTVLF